MALEGRGGWTPVAIIPAEQLLPLDQGDSERWRERRTQAVELPERVAVVYMDKDADYQQGSQSAQRVAHGPALPRRLDLYATRLSYLDVGTTAGRRDSRAIQLASSGTGRIIRSIPPRQTVILAFAARFTRTDNPTGEAFIVLDDPTSTQIVITVNFLDGRYRCYRGWFDAEIAQSAVDVAAVAKEQYHWFELKVTIDATIGIVELFRNGAGLLTFSGNTKGTPTGEISRVQLRSMNVTSSNRVDVPLDDIAIADDLAGRAAAHHGSKTMVPCQLSMMAAVIVRSIQDNRLVNHARLCCIELSLAGAARQPEPQDALPVGAMQEPDDGRIWQSSVIDPLASIDLSRLLARRACRCAPRWPAAIRAGSRDQRYRGTPNRFRHR